MAPSGETPEPRDTPHLTPLDPERILRLLNQAGVEYVLIGGFAVVIHGYERLTGDLDICYARSRENVKRLVDVLHGLHAWPREWPEGLPFILDDQTILNGDSFTFNTDAGDLDLVGTPDGSHGYSDLIPGSESYELADALVVHVVGLDDLIRLKHASGLNAHRAQKDLLDATMLEEIRDRSRAHDADG
jgi:hypothetical protein